MTRTLTNGLAAAVVVLTVAAALAAWRAGTARAAALDAGQDLVATRADLADLAAWHVTASAGDGDADTSDLNRRIRAAAAAAGVVDRLVSVEPGPTARARDSDLVRTPIYVRAEAVTVRGLMTFLHDLTAADPAVRVTGIDLSAPPAAAPAAGGPETWTADVTLSESAVAPAKEGRP